jgi:hypothetical protein
MIPFFRKIRKQMADDNRPLKYARYAIGEIVLVVVGILIALSINNWNTKRIERETEKDYIHRLAKELRNEIDYYKIIRDGFINKEKSLIRIVMVWQSNSPILHDSLQYINDFTWAGNISSWYSEPITWTQLIQSGELKFIKNQKLIDASFAYFNNVKKISINYQMHPMELTNKGRKVLLYPFKNENPKILFESLLSKFESKPNNIVFEIIWNKRNEYIDLYMSIAFASKVQSLQIQRIIDSGQLLLEQLKSYE